MNTDESARETLQDTSLLSSSSLEPGSKERSVLSGLRCGYCGIPVDELHPQVGKKRKKLLLGILDDPEKPICCVCFGRHKPKKLRSATDAAFRGRMDSAISAAQDGQIRESAFDVLNEARGNCASLERRIENAFRELDNLNRLKNSISKRADTLERLHGKLLASQYESRRKEANYFISKRDVRLLVFGRDDFACRECRSPHSLSVDHIVSVINDGPDDIENLQTLCSSCNSKKGSK